MERSLPNRNSRRFNWSPVQLVANSIGLRSHPDISDRGRVGDDGPSQWIRSPDSQSAIAVRNRSPESGPLNPRKLPDRAQARWQSIRTRRLAKQFGAEFFVGRIDQALDHLVGLVARQCRVVLLQFDGHQQSFSIRAIAFGIAISFLVLEFL